MKSVVAAVIAVGICFACLQIALVRAQNRDEAARAAALAAELAAVRAETTAHRQRLEARLAALEAVPATQRRHASQPVARESTPTRKVPQDPPVSSAGESTARQERLEAAIETLTSRQTRDSERQALWTSLGKDGLLDDALRAFEARVEEEPKNPDRHTELGAAYVQKILTVGELEKGVWATKADRAFDRALELDPAHWEARFTKAAALAYWPPIFGKSAEAARHFETLIEQQESKPAERRFATTYLFLGNLYQNQGNLQRARETWSRGVERFPEDAELKRQLAGVEAAAEQAEPGSR